MFMYDMCNVCICGKCVPNLLSGTIVLHVHHSDPLRVPALTVNASSSTVEYQIQRSDSETTRINVGHEVFRFGVPVLGRYINTFTGRRVTFTGAVPGAQYRITAWTLNNVTRSATPAVEYVTTKETREFTAYIVLAHFHWK